MSVDPHSRLAELLHDPLHGVVFARLRDRHQPMTVDDGLGWRKGHHPQICRTRATSWPCEIGMALAIIGWLLTAR